MRFFVLWRYFESPPLESPGILIIYYIGRSRDGLYEPVLAESEREAVADLLRFLENVRHTISSLICVCWWIYSVVKKTSFQANRYGLWALWCFRIMSTYSAVQVWLSQKSQNEVCISQSLCYSWCTVNEQAGLRRTALPHAHDTWTRTVSKFLRSFAFKNALCWLWLICVSVDVREVDRDTLEPILFLLQNPDIEVQRAASAALGNLAVNSTWIYTDPSCSCLTSV